MTLLTYTGKLDGPRKRNETTLRDNNNEIILETNDLRHGQQTFNLYDNLVFYHLQITN